MIDRDLLLLLTGGLIGSLSSLITLVAVYLLEGLRLRRKWRREDELQLRDSRAELEGLLSNAFTQNKPSGKQIDPDQADASERHG